MTEETKSSLNTLEMEKEENDDVFRFTNEDCELPSDVVKVEVAEGVTSIPKGAFKDCESLITIRLSSTVTSIEEYAFYNCTNLEEIINLPEGLISIGKCAFSGCHQLFFKELILPNTLESLGEFAFQNCRKLESIVIPSNKITSIGDFTFRNCQSMKSVELPPTVESLGEESFQNCISLTEINIPNEIKCIGSFCFRGCLQLELDFQEFFPLPSEVKDTTEKNKKNPWSPSSWKERKESIQLKDGPGAKNGFIGTTQRRWGPEYWAITDQQLELLKEHPLYDRKNGLNNDFTMREFVSLEIIKNTKGLEIGLGLLFNQLDPKLAHVMVSHAWDEPVPEFVEALQDSKVGGPYWVCSSAIYQNDKKLYGPTIEDQLGEDPEFGPFATVLRSVKVMVAILTLTCNIYTRLWCVYEMYMARKLGVKVVLSPYDGGYKKYGSALARNVCIANASEKVDSARARCGHPSQPMNDDERTIRRVIMQSPQYGFEAIDEAVEMIRFEYLIEYDTETILYDKTIGRNHLRNAIETIMARLPKNAKLLKFDSFLQRKLKQRPDFESVPEKWDYKLDEDGYGFSIGNHDYYIMNKENNDEKIDVYKLWINLLEEGLHDLNE